MRHEKHPSAPVARHFLEIQGFRPEPGSRLKFYRPGGGKAALVPKGKAVLVVYKEAVHGN